MRQLLRYSIFGVFITYAIASFGLNNNQLPKDSITPLQMAEKMAFSEMTQFPEGWQVDFTKKPVWSYTQGLVASSMIKLWKTTSNKTYYNYAKSYADALIEPDGIIRGYQIENYNIDMINSGKFLFDLVEETKEAKYQKVIQTLRSQLKNHPRTSEGGFWHKKRYTSQMWLDGLYMGAPFYAQYAVTFKDTAGITDVARQFEIVHSHTYNAQVGLNYHGWDESKAQQWADSITGCSPNFWGRAEGWYFMALVDALDFMPKKHPQYKQLVAILNQVAAGVVKYQADNGLWYQVLDQSNREGNYFESSASSMFCYALAKSVRLGYISNSYIPTIKKAYNSIVHEFVKDNGNNTISITRGCAVAGLGGKPYRSGSFEYYIGEPIRDNDPKAVGPFIMACLEMQTLLTAK